MSSKFTFHVKAAAIAFLCILSAKTIGQNCVWSTQSPGGTLTVSGNSQTLVGLNVNPGTFSIENFTVAGQYAIAASFGSYFTLTDNSNNPIVSGVNTLTVTIPTAGLYRIHLSSNSSCSTIGGSRIVAITPTNRALDVDGVDDYANVGNSLTAALNGLNKLTVEAWVKPTSLSGLGCIVGNYSSPVSGNLQMLLRRNTNSYYEFWVGNGTTWNQVTSAAIPTVGVWQHVAGTWDGSVSRIFINGVLSGTVATTIPSLNNLTNQVWIGANNIAENFAGDIDEVRIWSRELCQGEIQHNMNAEIPTTASGLVANYHFNQGVSGGNNSTVTTLIDDSGNSYNGTLTNMALTGTTSNWIAPGAFGDGIYATPFVSPTVSIAGSNTVCTSNFVTLTASGNVSTYAWVSGPTTATNAVSPTTITSYSVTGTNSVGCISNMAVFTVSTSTSPTVSVSNGTICAGNSFTIVPNGANTYTIQGGSAVVSPTTNTSYTVVGSSTAGCVSVNTATSSITVNANPTVSVNSGSICSGDSFTISPSGASTYTIQGGNAVVTPTANASYTVIGTSSQGCVSDNIATSNITVNTTPTVSVNSGSICSGSSFTMSPTGASTYSYSSGSAVVSPTANAAYTVTGTSTQGCTGTAISNVVVSICSGAEALNFDGTSPGDNVLLPTAISTSLSTKNNITVEAWARPTSLSGLGCIIGNYSTPNNEMQFLLRMEGSFYRFWVGNSGFGTYSSAFSSASPTLNVWQHIAGVWDGSVVSIYVNGVLSGTTSVTYSNFGVSSNTLIIGGNAINENFTGDIDEIRIWDRALCQGEIVNNMNGEIPTNASGLMANYHFNQGLASQPNPTVTTLLDATSNTYNGNLTGFALTGSTSNWVSPGAVTGSVTPFVSPTVAITGANAICNGSSTTLTANGNVTSYNWVSGPTTATNVITPTVTTSYSVSGMNAGCSSNMASITVTVNSLPTISASTSSSIICGPPFQGTATISASGATTYTWNTAATTSSISVSPSVTTVYTVTGTDLNGCENMAVITQSVSACTGINGINIAVGAVSVYPNPNNGMFTVNIPDFNSTTTITVVNVIGETVLKQNVTSEKTQINLNDLSNGIYLVKIDNNQTTQIYKIIKQ
jgi:hypothetical protein